MSHLTIITQAATDMLSHGHVFSAVFAADPPELTTLINLILSWTVKIAGSIGILYLVFSLVGQLDPAKRDVRAMVMELVVTLIVLVCIAKSSDMAKTLLAAVGIS